MTQLSKEINEKLKACEFSHPACLAPVSVGLFREMARRLLAAEAQEPVGLFAKRGGTWLELCVGDTFEHPDAVPLYAAPQPVAVPDGLRLALSNAGISAPESDEMLFATHEKYVQLLVDWVKERKPFLPVALPDKMDLLTCHLDGVTETYAEGWNACRAKMLQPSSGALQLLQWIKCSERMPEVKSTVLVYMNEPQHSATDYAVADFDKYGFSRSKVTHWMPLPAAPQEPTK